MSPPIPHYIDVMGLWVGAFGIFAGLYLHFVSPYRHDIAYRAGFVLLGTAIVMLSSQAFLMEEVLVLTGRLVALTILMVLQAWLFLRVYLRGPFPTPRQAMKMHLMEAGACEAGENLGYVEMYRRALETVRNGGNG